ncbi:MAG: hypothetical protein WBB23_09105 [Desulforhopalus sp.]
MDAVTFPSKDAVNFVNNNLIPQGINVNDDTTLDVYHHFWTPALTLLKNNGNKPQRTIEFLGMDEFTASMLLGIAKLHPDAGEYDTAMIPLKSLPENLPESKTVLEAMYFRGVTHYKETNGPGKLKEEYEKLLSDYPDNVWTERVYSYCLL